MRPPGAGRVEDEDFVAGLFENLPRVIDAGRRVAELARDDDWLVRAGLGFDLDDAADRPGGASENLARDAVQPRDIHDARETSRCP